MTRHLLTAALLLCASLCCAQAVTLPPSAAELSEVNEDGDSELQVWLDASLGSGETVRLPSGVITIHKPLRIRRTHGGIVEGSGPPFASRDSKSGWRIHPEVRQCTTTITTTDPTQPVIIIEVAKGIELRNFGVETTGVGILYRHVKGWAAQNTHLHRIAFHGCKVGFQAGELATDHNAADVTFYSPQFYRCETGLEVNHQQGVNYLFDGLPFFGGVNRAVVFNEGGFSHLENCTGFAVGTWLTINGGGSNLQPSRITHLYSDRTKEDPPPVIVDASGTDSVVRVIVDGVKVTQHGKEDALGRGHSYYRAGKASKIRVRDNDLNTYPAGGVYEPFNQQEP
ncbi:hypothetical protein [Botrimarina mediterranea]|uniref:hypothetical protein n=1 Tax=Botrimarina mediterranea TaxID=2528022 RepID=UPI00118B7D5D|nr:hypothetical protein K2D_16710 [Planctomycetes bacterium K2D]